MLIQYLIFTTFLFLIGVWGLVLNNNNVLLMLMSIELMLLAISFNFIIFSIYLDDIVGQIFTLYILVIAASEAAIGLAILISYYRVKGTLAILFTNLLKN